MCQVGGGQLVHWTSGQVDKTVTVPVTMYRHLCRALAPWPQPQARVDLIANTEESTSAALPVRKMLADSVAQAAEARRPWMARPKVQAMLGDQGVYDRLSAPSPAASNALEDLSY